MWRRPLVGADLQFGGEIASTLRAVIGDAGRMPFPDGAFDLVISVSLLSVAGGEVARAACEEMARVSRGRVLVITPFGRDAHDSDVRMLEWCRRAGVESPAWLEEQVADGMPEGDDIVATLSASGRSSAGRCSPRNGANGCSWFGSVSGGSRVRMGAPARHGQSTRLSPLPGTGRGLPHLL